MPLTVTEIKNAKAFDKPIKLSDELGLLIIVQPNGGKWWRFKYRFDKLEKSLSLGTFPEVSLKDAREARDTMRQLLNKGVDPAANRKASKNLCGNNVENSIEVVGREWFQKHSPNWVKSHSSKIISRLERDIFPWLGSKSIAEITAPEILVVLRRIENRGAIETAHRALQDCGKIFMYAIATGRASANPASSLKGAIPPTKVKHHPSLTDPIEIGKLLRAIKQYKGFLPTRCALQIAPMVFVRPGELRNAEWSEFDLNAGEWRIRAERMKMRKQHIVPLSTQAVAILKELHPLTGHGKLVFTATRNDQRPLSENTLNVALRQLGYTKDQMTAHGFRSIASTLLNEQGWNRDAIERQLAHAEHDSVRSAYNYAEYLTERREMMQKWSDYLDELEATADTSSNHV